MDLHQLFIFTKVAEHKSFSKAAENIFLSQSTVSAHIQSLEKSLNITLFDRVGRETILTPKGERLYDWAQKILLLKDEAILDIADGNPDFYGDMRVATSSVPGQFILPNMIKNFRKDHSRVTFHIDQSSSKNVVEKVLNGSVDFGILGEKFENERLEYITLTKEKLVLITSKKVKLENPVELHKIIDFPLIMRSADSGTNTILEKSLKHRNLTKEALNIAAYTNSGEGLVQYVIQDIGIAIISEIAAKEYYKNKLINMYEIKDFNDERHFYLVHNKYKTQSLISKLFINEATNLL